jgi:hypothetical protein
MGGARVVRGREGEEGDWEEGVFSCGLQSCHDGLVLELKNILCAAR